MIPLFIYLFILDIEEYKLKENITSFFRLMVFLQVQR